MLTFQDHLLKLNLYFHHSENQTAALKAATTKSFKAEGILSSLMPEFAVYFTHDYLLQFLMHFHTIQLT